MAHLELHIKTAVLKLFYRDTVELWHRMVRHQVGRALDENMSSYMQLGLTPELFCCEVMLFGKSCSEGLCVAPHGESSNYVNGRFLQNLLKQSSQAMLAGLGEVSGN